MGQVLNRTQCPCCKDTKNDNLIHYPNGVHCFACGYSTRGNKVAMTEKSKLPLLPMDKLCFGPMKSRNISEISLRRYNVGFTPYRGWGTDVVVFPFYKEGTLCAQKIKTKDKRITILGDISECGMFGSQTFNGEPNKLVITEGEEDAIAVSQVISGNIHVTSLTNGANCVDKWISKHYEKLIKYKQLILCFDQDEAGQKAVKDFKAKFPVGKVGVVKLSEKDACDMLKADKDNDLKWSVLTCKPERPSGVMKVSDITLEYFKESLPKGIDLPYPKANWALNGLRKGELTMLTSGTGIGKSTFCTNLIYSLITQYGLSIADIKLEQSQKRTVYAYLAMMHGIPLEKMYEDPTIISEDQLESFKSKFEGLYVHDHFGSLDSRELLAVLDYYSTILDVDFIVLDHISIAVSGIASSQEGERKDIDILVTKMRELIERTGVGIVCVCHLSNPPHGQVQWEDGRPVKRCDLRGSGALAQLSDNIIAIEGNLSDEDVKDIRQLKVIKTRYGRSQEAYCDKFRWDYESGIIKLLEEDF